MFSAFKNAWSRLIASMESFASSIEQANSLFREHFHLDAAPETPALPDPAQKDQEEQPSRNGRGRSKVTS